MRSRRAVCGSSVLFFCATSVFSSLAMGASELDTVPILISVEQLRGMLRGDALRIVDVRAESDYQAGHIPGAVRVDVGKWKGLAAAENGFRDTNGWAKTIGKLGVDASSRVVVYGNKLSDTARVWWLLKYVGVKNVSMLDGGWEWWTKNANPTENSIPNITATEFKPDFQVDRLAEIESLKTTFDSANTKIVDTRSDREFNEGRIPGATQLEWSQLIAKDGRFKTKPELQRLFRENGILPAETAVCY